MLSRGKVEELIRKHVERRPLIRAVDVYKLLYQGIFGVGHILGENALERLGSEARGLDLDEQPDEPLLEEVSINSSMVRVNLRPYLRSGLSLGKLYSAMKQSQFRGDPREFLRIWGIFVDLVRSGRWQFDPKELMDLDSEIKSGRYAPKHHSRTYRENYSPAYRVVKRKAVEETIRKNNYRREY